MKKKIMLPIFVVCMLFIAQICVYAAETWSNSGAYEISEGDGWHNHTTEGIMLGNYKTTESSDIEVYTVSKTMSSKPVFRLVNSEEKSRSESFSTAGTFRSVKNSI